MPKRLCQFFLQGNKRDQVTTTQNYASSRRPRDPKKAEKGAPTVRCKVAQEHPWVQAFSAACCSRCGCVPSSNLTIWGHNQNLVKEVHPNLEKNDYLWLRLSPTNLHSSVVVRRENFPDASNQSYSKKNCPKNYRLGLIHREATGTVPLGAGTA